MRRSWWALGALVLALGFWLTPQGLSLYHQEQGGRLLDEALAVEGHDGAEESWPLLWEPLTTEEARALTEEALVSFRTAVAADRRNGQAYRWLGRASLLLDDPEAAVLAFSAYARLRPENPLGWWELGLAYERLARRVDGAVYWALDPGPGQDGAHTLPEPTPLVTATLDAAEVETPDVAIDTPYCEQEPVLQSCFVAAAEWEMPDAPQEMLWTPEQALRRAVLFMHPPSQATFTVTLPVTPTALTFWMGIEPTAWPWMGDGVGYRVWVDGTEVFSHALTTEEAREGWWPGKVDLGPWAGREVRLTLETDPGPAGDGQGDWAGWGEVRLVEAEAADAVLADPVRRAVAAWREGWIAAWQLIAAGETARKAGRYEEALGWYERAAWAEPGLGDPWYYMGLAYEGMERWEEALEAYERAVETRALSGVHRSSPYYRMGRIYQWRLEPRQTNAALAAYGAALAVDDFSTVAEAADCHYKRGEILWWTRGDPDEYIAEFRQAVELNPKHASAYILLGVAYYSRDRDVTTAEAEIRQAIELSPQNKWAYYHLGEIYRQEGRMEEATAAYEQALEIDPEFEAARKRLVALREEK